MPTSTRKDFSYVYYGRMWAFAPTMLKLNAKFMVDFVHTEFKMQSAECKVQSAECKIVGGLRPHRIYSAKCRVQSAKLWVDSVHTEFIVQSAECIMQSLWWTSSTPNFKCKVQSAKLWVDFVHTYFKLRRRPEI